MLLFFFFNDTATTEIYTLSLHDALPIWSVGSCGDPSVARSDGYACHRCCRVGSDPHGRYRRSCGGRLARDRKSTRLNSSHLVISYAVFCLKKKNTQHYTARSAALCAIAHASLFLVLLRSHNVVVFFF